MMGVTYRGIGTGYYEVMNGDKIVGKITSKSDLMTETVEFNVFIDGVEINKTPLETLNKAKAFIEYHLRKMVLYT